MKKISLSLLVILLINGAHIMNLFAAPKKGIVVNKLYALKIEPNATEVTCRSLPFLAAPVNKRENTKRTWTGTTEKIPIGTKAETLYLLGMINWGGDYGLAHWIEHSEVLPKRDDQVQVGSKIGDIEICYADGDKDRIPVIMGATAWFFNGWKYLAHVNGGKQLVREPFASRPEYMKVLRQSLQVKENGEYMESSDKHAAYYLPVTPKQKEIESIVIINNDELRGNILISGVTVRLPAGISVSSNLMPFGKKTVEKDDLTPSFATSQQPDFSPGLQALSNILYTSMADLPTNVTPIDFPSPLKGTKIQFISDEIEGSMLSNIWIANLMDIHDKFNSKTGCFLESGKKNPCYGGYSGIGTWEGLGIYPESFSRCSDQIALLALQYIKDTERITSFVDFCDHNLYFFRANRDPEKGPRNDLLDIGKYPVDAPPHWSFCLNHPMMYTPSATNEISGDEEMEGHAATMVARWHAWKLMGKPTGEWMTLQRDSVYKRSRWQSTVDAADFICWLMDYTGRDVIYSEGEITGWGGPWLQVPQVPAGMLTDTDPKKIKENYANADMYEPYASYGSIIALQCSAEIAEAMGDNNLARKYREYAGRIRLGMIRLLATGAEHQRTWKKARHSVLPSMQDCLVHGWYSFHREGLDPQRLDNDMAPITRHTLDGQLNQKYGHAPVLAMGYGIGWLTHPTLVFDEMDHAGALLVNIARYAYDKNMNYVDASRGIDWRKWMWLIPEGTNIMPDGRWYRISDLGNGANQAPVLRTLAICAGVDDADQKHLRLLPRIANPMEGIRVTDYPAVVSDGNKCEVVNINYTYERGKSFALKSEQNLPELAIRFGPYTDMYQVNQVIRTIQSKGLGKVRYEYSGTYEQKPALWIWVEDLTNLNSYSINDVYL